MSYCGNYYGGLGYGCGGFSGLGCGCGWGCGSFRTLGCGRGWGCGSFRTLGCGRGWGARRYDRCRPLCCGGYGFSTFY